MISFDEAAAIIAEAARPLGEETIPLMQAHRRVLARPVVAKISAPACDVSTMDGYAVREADLRAAPARLRILGESWPGTGFADAVELGECVRIFTGAPVPPGADHVVIQEAVRRDGAEALFESWGDGPRYSRAAGSDFRAGDTLLEDGTLLEARQLVAAAAADMGDVEVWRRPDITMLCTGDELSPPGTAAGRAGSVPESLSVGIAALVETWGGRFTGSVLLGDDLPRMEAEAGRALDSTDLIVVTGGASVGERDFAKRMFEPHGLKLLFSKVAMKPGKPVWFGRAGGTLVLGLPGNPTSAMVTARLLLAPSLAGLSGLHLSVAHRWRKMPLADATGAVGERETFARGTMEGDCVRLAANQDSGAQRALAQSDLLVRLPAGGPGRGAGEMVDVLDF
jgi:molybdopterin molybdotransferase